MSERVFCEKCNDDFTVSKRSFDSLADDGFATCPTCGFTGRLGTDCPPDGDGGSFFAYVLEAE